MQDALLALTNLEHVIVNLEKKARQAATDCSMKSDIDCRDRSCQIVQLYLGKMRHYKFGK
jgi:hypothetical protein